MKIWFDILTPKQLLFFEPIIKKLQKNNQILCTSRQYNEVAHLAKIRNFRLKIIGRHGGAKKYDKLEASLKRMQDLAKTIREFSPNATVSFCSPEAARISYGLGIRHIAFSDSPHATAVMRLTIPLIQKLMIPWIIPKEKFLPFGIDKNNIVQYRAIDGALISTRFVKKQKLPFSKNNKKVILFRMEEDQAAYSQKNNNTIAILKKMVTKLENHLILVSVRYRSQEQVLTKLFGKKIKILGMKYDGKLLLENSDVFIGSGGTMTAESAFLGVPTISYNAVPNLIEDYLVRKKLIIKERNPTRISKIAGKMLLESNQVAKKRVKKIRNTMEDPLGKLCQLLNFENN